MFYFDLKNDELIHEFNIVSIDSVKILLGFYFVQVELFDFFVFVFVLFAKCADELLHVVPGRVGDAELDKGVHEVSAHVGVFEGESVEFIAFEFILAL